MSWPGETNAPWMTSRRAHILTYTPSKLSENSNAHFDNQLKGHTSNRHLCLTLSFLIPASASTSFLTSEAIPISVTTSRGGLHARREQQAQVGGHYLTNAVQYAKNKKRTGTEPKKDKVLKQCET
jgi:hypothetical protein